MLVNQLFDYTVCHILQNDYLVMCAAYSVVELRISSYNQLDPNENVQTEAANALNQIQIILNGCAKIRALSQTFEPTYAIVVSWKNTVPNPAVFYQYREVSYATILIYT